MSLSGRTYIQKLPVSVSFSVFLHLRAVLASSLPSPFLPLLEDFMSHWSYLCEHKH